MGAINKSISVALSLGLSSFSGGAAVAWADNAQDAQSDSATSPIASVEGQAESQSDNSIAAEQSEDAVASSTSGGQSVQGEQSAQGEPADGSASQAEEPSSAEEAVVDEHDSDSESELESTTSDDVELFVERLYRLVLNRDPDEKGFKRQCKAIKKGTSGSQIALNFFTSEEFQSRNLSYADQVEIAYKTLLDRSSDESGKAAWTEAMRCGMSIEGIVAGFSQSTEFNKLCSKWGITVGNSTPSEARNRNLHVTIFVHQLYESILDREPSTSELNHWCKKYFTSGGCYEVVKGFICSSEFSNRGLSLTDLVDTCYLALFDRSAETAGKSSWAHRIKNGLSLQNFAICLCISSEFNSQCESQSLNPGTSGFHAPSLSAYDGCGPTEYVAVVGGKTINTSYLNNAPYLFLPSTASLSDIALSFETYVDTDYIYVSANSDEGFVKFQSGDTLDIESLNLAQDSNGAYLLYVKDEEDSTDFSILRIMKSADVLTMYIMSDDPENAGRAYVESDWEHNTKASATMVLVAPDGTVRYGASSKNSAITIKGRGNTTWRDGEKKPYQIKLNKKTDLLDSGDSSNKSKTWILLANSADVTLIHNAIAYDLAASVGLEYTPEYQYVDLYYDGEYRGNYMLCEKVEVESGRVDIEDLEDANEEANPDVDLETLPTAQAVNSYGMTYQYVEGMSSPEDVTKGYLLENDTVYYKSETCWFKTSLGLAFVVKSPEYASKEEMAYISEKFEKAIRCVANNGDISQYFDVYSLAKTHLIREVAMDLDVYSTSTYYYLDGTSGLIYAGPVWDFDSSFGSRTSDATGHAYSRGHNSYFGTPLNNNTYFQNTLKAVYRNMIRPLLLDVLEAHGVTQSQSLKSIDAYVASISASQKMDTQLWGLNTFYFCVDPESTYDGNIDYLKEWLANRTYWLDTQWL